MTLDGQVALVTGGTREAGRGMAVELGAAGAAGAAVYVTGRTTKESRSPLGRPETIEDTARLVTEAGGTGIAVWCDHMVPDDVVALARRENWRDGIEQDKWFAISESPRYIGRAVAALAADPDRRRWSGQSLCVRKD